MSVSRGRGREVRGAGARRLTFRDVVNAAIRDGLLRGETESPCVPPVHDLGIRPGVDLTKALQLVGQLEDEAVVQKIEIGK